MGRPVLSGAAVLVLSVGDADQTPIVSPAPRAMRAASVDKGASPSGEGRCREAASQGEAHRLAAWLQGGEGSAVDGGLGTGREQKKGNALAPPPTFLMSDGTPQHKASIHPRPPQAWEITLGPGSAPPRAAYPTSPPGKAADPHSKRDSTIRHRRGTRKSTTREHHTMDASEEVLAYRALLHVPSEETAANDSAHQQHATKRTYQTRGPQSYHSLHMRPHSPTAAGTRGPTAPHLQTHRAHTKGAQALEYKKREQ